jgi:hypothetical protein
MDEINERLVIDRIVEDCCGDDGKPQYFLVTPKLLPALRALNHEDVTILLVLNGAGVLQKWIFPQILKKYISKNSSKKNQSDDETDNERISELHKRGGENLDIGVSIKKRRN